MTTSRRGQMKYPEDGILSIKSDDGDSCRPQDVSLDDALCGREATKHEHGDTARCPDQRRTPLSVLLLHPGNKHRFL